MPDPSPAMALIEDLVARFGAERAHAIVDEMLDEHSTLDRAALEHDWKGFWARPSQLPPETGWRSFGNFGARGIGKTRTCGEFLNIEVRAGRAGSIGCAAQNEDKAIELQIEGKSGLIATAPPWFKPRWEATRKQLVWPNGARAYVYTPEAPGPVRGQELDHGWLSEIQSWPVATRKETYLNFLFAIRIGAARMLWDATPKRGHPILLALLGRAKREPEKHIVRTGETRDNEANLARGVIDDLEAEFGGTAQGEEELKGRMLDEADGATAKQEWIDRNRRPMPTADAIVRRGLGIDVAVTDRAGSDRTGMIDAGLSVDGQALVFEDLSGRYSPPEWARVALDRYVSARCDVIVVETNKGGQLVTQNLRAAAEKRKLTVIVLGKDEKKPHNPRVVYVREVYSRGEKRDRAQPLSTAYEANRVSHVIGADLVSLELTLTTWVPKESGPSPDDLDAEVSIVGELLGLKTNAPNKSAGFKGVVAANRLLVQPSSAGLAAMLRGRNRGGI